MDQTDTATDRFIHAENIILFRKRLTETINACSAAAAIEAAGRGRSEETTGTQRKIGRLSLQRAIGQ